MRQLSRIDFSQRSHCAWPSSELFYRFHSIRDGLKECAPQQGVDGLCLVSVNDSFLTIGNSAVILADKPLKISI
jgi:hypothetical protein